MRCLVPVLVWRMRTVKSQYNEYLVTAEISSSIWNTAALRTWRVALRTKLYQKLPPTFECNTHAIVFNYADHNDSTRSNENAHIVMLLLKHTQLTVTSNALDYYTMHKYLVFIMWNFPVDFETEPYVRAAASSATLNKLWCCNCRLKAAKALFAMQSFVFSHADLATPDSHINTEENLPSENIQQDIWY